MATVYSLVCWGGRTGKTVTLTIASPCVVTSANHGLRDGTRLVFSTTGALPTGITAGVTYYAKSTAANTFNLYTDEALASVVNTSGTQSGTHAAKSVLMGEYFVTYSGRWGGAGSERCYDGLVSWNSARAGASSLDVEVCELGQAYDDAMTSATGFSVNTPAAKVIITSSIAGVRTEAFHNGVVRAGYALWRTTSSGATATLWLPVRGEANGFTIYHTNSSYQPSGIAHGVLGAVKNMILLGTGPTTSGAGIMHAACSTTLNCLSMRWSFGFSTTYNQYGITIANCTACKNNIGFSSSGTSSTYGYYYNNISVGNTTNWGTTSGFTSASANFGAAGDSPWVTGGNPTYTIATTDFFNYGGASWSATDDLSPASVASPQVDAGISFYGYGVTDLRGAEVPNYNNGGSESIDAGCYEFDHGYGNHPITATLTLTGLVSGTDVVVRAAGTSTILDSVDATSGNWTYAYGSAHNVDIDVIKPGMVIVTFRNLALTAASSTLPVSQQFDRNYE